MRRRVCIFGLVAAMCLTAFSACGKKFDTNPGWESGGDSQNPVTGETGGGDLGETDFSEGDSGPQDTESASGERVFTKDFDGIVMTIVTDKSEYRVGETIYVTASLENTRDEDIYLYYGTSTRDGYSEELGHYLVELVVNIRNWYKEPADPVGRDESIGIVPVHPGEKHVQDYKFQTYPEAWDETGEEIVSYPYLDWPAEPGVYDGKFDMWFCDDCDAHGPLTNYMLDFPITLK